MARDGETGELVNKGAYNIEAADDGNEGYAALEDAEPNKPGEDDPTDLPGIADPAKPATSEGLTGPMPCEKE